MYIYIFIYKYEYINVYIHIRLECRVDKAHQKSRPHVCCGVLRCVAVCCSVLQCAATLDLRVPQMRCLTIAHG